MRLDFVTAVSGIFDSPLHTSILKRAEEQGTVEFVVHDLRDYTHDRHRSVDDAPYGGGAGMILKCEPIFECLDRLRSERDYDEVILLAADGEVFTQSLANRLSLATNLAFVCGHYKGVDDRVRQGLATRVISIGEYVLTGGELPALVVADAIVRLIPGVLHDSQSALEDSFQTDMVDCPQFTRPREFRGMAVPEVLLDGNHEEIRKWREAQAAARTAARVRGQS